MTSTIDLSFRPNARRAEAIDRSLNEKLFLSLLVVEEEAKSLGLTLAIGGDASAAGIAVPATWMHYHNLCEAIVREDLTAVHEAAVALRDSRRPLSSGRVTNLTDENLGRGCAASVACLIDDNPSFPLDLEPVDSASVDRILDLLPATLQLIRDVSPDLAVEIDLFARQIVLARGRRALFGGAATIFLWGAILLNPDEIPNRLSFFEALTHETAHSLLTGLSGGKDVTTNDPSLVYASPLREDPRPMEGIAHATFVLARMVFALCCLKEAPALSKEESSQLDEKIAQNIRLFEAGRQTVNNHASFTPEGRVIFSSCFAEMDRLLYGSAAAALSLQ